MRYQTEEEVRKDLDEATMLYLSCPDPTEAAARRQRVLLSDVNGQTEETTAAIMRAHGLPTDHMTIQTHKRHEEAEHARERVLQELHSAALQYMSSANPTEAAARRQRVTLGDAEGQTEDTAASILAAEEDQRRSLSPWERGIIPVSPPGIDFETAMQNVSCDELPEPEHNKDIERQKKGEEVNHQKVRNERKPLQKSRAKH
ncbi:unnamed protein product [Eruca vesicaria subsp. sativa]|uniref:Uncharacterized protein n=1 Tax=Eruca vesicaria subsp. sativa TaxID=29727 RepID=A0ABC8JJJ0_ERUVS|nr:unnamed protein product [Eruca vesicaria subsp. sativa]